MQMILSASLPIDSRSRQQIATEMVSNGVRDAYLYQHWDGEWLWTTNETDLPTGGHVVGVSLSRCCQ